jgi:hypothetical protein
MSRSEPARIDLSFMCFARAQILGVVSIMRAEVASAARRLSGSSGGWN